MVVEAAANRAFWSGVRVTEPHHLSIPEGLQLCSAGAPKCTTMQLAVTPTSRKKVSVKATEVHV